MKQQVCLSRAVWAGLLVTCFGLSLLVAGEAVLVVGHQTFAASAPMKGRDVSLDATASGAKCNGSTDDTTAIQSAIDTVWTNGGIVLFPAQTCVVSNLIWRQGVVLRGRAQQFRETGEERSCDRRPM
jgi:hypothetical protein